jgi:hypothetical protein
MYISNEFVDREGLKVLFPNVSQSRIDDLWNVNIFGTPTQFSGFDVVDRGEAVRAGEIVFAEDRPQKKASEPETPAYTPEDQKQINISNDVIARFGNNKSEEDQYRVLCARKRIKKIEEKYNQPAIDKKAIQAEIDEWEQKKAQLMAEAEECHKVNTPVPARIVDHTIRCNRQITDLRKKLNS